MSLIAAAVRHAGQSLECSTIIQDAFWEALVPEDASDGYCGIAERVSIAPSDTLILREVQPMPVCLRPFPGADVLQPELIEPVRRSVVCSDRVGNAGYPESAGVGECH